MSLLRAWLWRWQMSRLRTGMKAADVMRRFLAPTRKTASGNIEIWIYDKAQDKDMLHSIRVALVDGCVNQVYLSMELIDGANSTGKAASPTDDEPFMEHPTGEHESAVAAMEDAVRRLRVLPSWVDWITFCAQGENPALAGTIKFAEVRLRGESLDAGHAPLDVAPDCRKSWDAANAIRMDGESYMLVVLAAGNCPVAGCNLSRTFGIRPFGDEKDDYTVGAEW